ncbi:MAG: ABC transporter substrate-binding protein [Rhodospirillales bacterium]
MQNRNRINRRSVLQGAAAVGVSLTIPAELRAAGKVNFYNWDTYIGETTLADFTSATGIDVQYDLYADNEELFAKLRGGNPGYDLIVPSNDYVERMRAADMLDTLDHSKIPNIKNIESDFMNPPFDPGRKYSLPYMWGTIGVGYRKSAMKGTPDSWKPLLDSDEYANRIALMNDGTTVLQVALKYLGKSLNDLSSANIKAATDLLIRQKPHITAFAGDNGQDLLLAGEVDLAMEWNGDISQAMTEDDDIGYYIPKEGGILWEDTLAIPKDAPNRENAHKMINFLLDDKVGAALAESILYATPNKAAKAHLKDDYLKNPSIFPSKAALSASEVSLAPNQKTIQQIDEAWTRVKSA